MFVHPVLLVIIVLLYVYLVATDIHLHRRVKKLEHTVRKLEGMNGGRKEEKHRWEGKEDLT